MPIVISSPPTKWPGYSPAIRTLWPGRLIADRCRFSLDELAYQYPEENTLPGLTAQQALEKLTWEGAAERYPEGLPDKVRATLAARTKADREAAIRAILPDG